MGHHTEPGGWLLWLLPIAAIVVIALLFRPVRVWLWGTWFWLKGILLGNRAKHYVNVDPNRVCGELDGGFHDVKEHYRWETGREIRRWVSGPQSRLVKRLGTLRVIENKFTEEQEYLGKKLEDERQNPPRERPRIKGLLYYTVGTLLAIADIALTFMCLQALSYPVIFLLPSAILLGIIGFLVGDNLGKNIEPAQKNPNKEKNRMAIVFLAAFSAIYCIVFGTMRFLYTQHDPSVSPLLDFVGSYGFIAVIVGCSIMLGWLHEGITTEERLAYVKVRRARIAVSIDRCDKQGAKMTDAFRAHLSALESESASVRSRFLNGFQTSWSGRAPRGVESYDSPLEFDEEILESLTWPNPPNRTVIVKRRSKATVDYSKYDEQVPQPLRAQPVPPRPVPPATRPVPRPVQTHPEPTPPPTPPYVPAALQENPPPIG